MNYREKVELSVVVPHLNGDKFIKTFIASIRAQEIEARRFELIVVDNGSREDAQLRLQEEIKLLECSTRVLSYTEKQSSYGARNVGARHAVGGLLVFTDIDCRPEPRWLSALANHLAQPTSEKYKLVAGPVKLFPQGDVFNPSEWFDACTFLRPEHVRQTGLAPTANLAFSRNLFDDLDGFHEVESGGDIEFCRRAKSKGASLKFLREMSVAHPARASSSEICKKLSRVARGYGEILHRKGLSAGQRIAALVKQLTALVVQPHLWRMLVPTLKHGGSNVLWVSTALAASLWFGLYFRCCMIRAILFPTRTRATLK